jgi:hypothetical protein
MSGQRVPGSTCAAEADLTSLADGTLARWLMPAAGSEAGICRKPAVEPPMLSCSPQVPDVSFLFNSCQQPARGFGPAALERAARALGVEVNVIKAVASVETAGRSFDKQGRPKILYERHYFHRLTGGVHAATHPHLSAPSYGGHNAGGPQYEKLEEAFALNGWAALQSASWGGFQIMGEHYALLGYASPHHMALAMATSEEAHLDAFVQFVLAQRHLLLALRGKQWTRFARGYNGPRYADNDYDTKMKDAYEALVAAERAAAAPQAPRPGPGPALSPMP